MKKFIQKAVEKRNLSEEEAKEAMKIIMSGKATPSQVAGFLIALKMKGETTEEIAGFAKIMRSFAKKVKPEIEGVLIDVCGTGGGRIKTFNISTTAMFIIAAAGVPVAKHGNRAVTSSCGSADVLEGLGINLNLDSGKIKESLEKIGIGFLFAPNYHPAMKYAMPTRREIGVRTVFNILGPLTNPANAAGQLMGVFEPGLTEKLAKVFKLLRLKRAMIVYGQPGLDEISNIGKTKISELKEGKIKTYSISPEELGIKRGKEEDLTGGDKKINIEILKDILSGKERGTKRDIVLLNAAAGIMIGGKARNIKEGLNLAEKILDSGKAYKKLEEFRSFGK